MTIEATLKACDALPEYESELYFRVMGSLFSASNTGAKLLREFRFRQLWVDDEEGFEKYRERVDEIDRRLTEYLRRS